MIAYVLGIASLGLAAYLLAEVATLPARQRQASVRRATNYGRLRLPKGPEALRFTERVLEPTKHKLAALALRATPRASVEAVTHKLRAAGLSRSITPTGFLAAKSALAISGLVPGALLGSRSPGGAVVLAIGFGAVAFFAPDFALTFKARSRRDRVRAELPDALDLLAVSVEAGLSFDGGIQKLTEHMHGPLVDEFSLALGEMRIGESRSDALKRLVSRVDSPEMSAFVRAIIQSDQLGISLGRIIRVQAADSRLRRQAAAEEKAMKAPIKMLFPTVLFIFPAMFLIILGPAVINLLEVF